MFQGTKLLSAILVAGVLTLSATVRADTMTSGKFTVGATEYGNLYDWVTHIGFQRDDGYDPIKPGMPREAWSVSAGDVYGFADVRSKQSGGHELWASASPGASLVVKDGSLPSISTALNGKDADGTVKDLLQIDQQFTLTDNVLRIAVKITNLSAASKQVFYKRNVDWDLGGTLAAPYGRERITVYNQSSVASYTFEENDWIKSPIPYFTAPISNPSQLGAWGAGFQLDLGKVKPGANNAVEFYIFHAINKQNEGVNDLLRQMKAAGATILQLTGESPAYPSADPVRSAGLGYGVPTVVPLPSAAWAGMALMGMVTLAHWRKRRRA